MSTGCAGGQRHTIAGGVMAHEFVVSGDKYKETAVGSLENQTKC